jgi:rare lipoprotein A (peptidoglycan hydrolase)
LNEKGILMKTTILATVIVSALLFVSATVWEGVSDVETAVDKPGNFSIATNAFPRNTVVDITNLENGKKVRVRVVSGLETNGLLATLSRNVADTLDLRNNGTCRIRMTQPEDEIAFAHFKLGPIAPAVTTALDNEVPSAVTAAPAATELIVNVIPVAVVAAEETLSPTTTTTTAKPVDNTPIAESLINAYADAQAVSDETVVAALPESTAETFTAAATEMAVANNGLKTTEPYLEDSFVPTAMITAIGAEPAAPAEMIPLAAIELVAQPAHAATTQQSWTTTPQSQTTIQVTAPQSQTTETQSAVVPTVVTGNKKPAVASTGNPSPVNIVPSENRLPQANQVAIDPQYLAPPIKTESAAQTTRPIAATPASTTSTYTGAQTPFSPFQAPLISSMEPNKWYVQVGVFTRAEYVEDEINRIGSGYPLAIQNVGTDTSPLFRVLLGPLNQGESSAMLKRFQSIGYTDAFVRHN